MNSQQIQKLMKKVAKPFDEKKKQEEAAAAIKRQEHEKNLIEMQQTITRIEEQYPNRGNCCCLWKNNIYAIKHKKLKIMNVNIGQVKEVFKLIEKQNDSEFYMQDEQTVTESKRMMDWTAKHYAQIKISSSIINNSATKDKDKLINMAMLGSLHEEFNKEFPGSTSAHFITAVRVMDSVMQNLDEQDFDE